MSTVRLFVEAPLAADTAIPLERDQANYLFNVMRLGVGDTLLLFNGRDGEWRAEVAEAGKKRGILTPVEQTRVQDAPPDIELIFAPIKKARTDFIVEKACELGCSAVLPVFTRFTNAERLRPDRLRAHMIEAAEQCGGLTIPVLHDPAKLGDVLRGWGARPLIFCDEARTAPPLTDAVKCTAPPLSILIGPEGGFAPEEVTQLRALPATIPASLGPRILRADTAAVAAIALVQSVVGDW